MIAKVGASNNFQYKCAINTNGLLNGTITSNNALLVETTGATPAINIPVMPAAVAYYAALFSSVRIAGFKYAYIPFNPNGQLAFEDTTLMTMPSPGVYNTTFCAMYTTWDTDGVETPWRSTVEDNFLNNNRMHYFNCARPYKSKFIRTFKYRPKTKIPTVEGNTNMGATGKNLCGQWHGFGSSIADTDAANGTHFQLAAFNLGRSSTYEAGGTSTPYGRIVFTFYAVARDRNN